MPFDQACTQAATGAQPGLQPGHLACIALVIIAKKVQQAMQRQDAQLGLQRMPRLAGLAARDAGGNHDIAKLVRLGRRKRQHVRRPIFATVAAVQGTVRAVEEKTGTMCLLERIPSINSPRRISARVKKLI